MTTLKILLILAIVVIMATGCSHLTTTQQRALSGGAIGAGTGAVLSVVTGGSILLGTAIGAGAGTVGGLIYDDVNGGKKGCGK
jgi:osmotically inducible lipoprotein OsmB